MSSGRQRVLWIAMALLTLGASGNPETVSLNHLEGKRGPVVLPHRAHAADYKGPDGASIACRDCHHTLTTDDTEVKPCVSCHALPNQPMATHGGAKSPRYAVEKTPGVFDIKTLVAHTQCFDGCHKQLTARKAKALKKCAACHPK